MLLGVIRTAGISLSAGVSNMFRFRVPSVRVYVDCSVIVIGLVRLDMVS